MEKNIRKVSLVFINFLLCARTSLFTTDNVNKLLLHVMSKQAAVCGTAA